eukprot:TRINITY_DN3057_c0_g1_i10.p1 TRINITY_DN3057_c0_g1~~TRINITY_DN3057_c0_g1_i10.p1  ORF type:complete len:502 (-),score=164.85 TRINITY_DN3057_c0_g1_i10:393-1898(-)
MGGPCGSKKGKSNRKQLHRKYREEKLVRQHHKKLKKVARKAKGAGFSAPGKRDPGIPNSAPHFKAEVLRDAALHKERLEEEREKRIEVQKAARRKKLAQKRGTSLEQLASDAGRRSDAFNQKNSTVVEDDGMKDLAGARDKAQYMNQLREVVAMADIVLVVLDARNPQGSRCKTLEDLVMRSGPNKRIILIMNKIDLVPRGVVQAWLKHLRMQLPTIAFKAVTAVSASANEQKIQATAGECLGGSQLIQLLKNYSRSHNIKKAITVGVVGFPNVGKSSLINSLKRGKAVGVSAHAGFTKALQEVKLDSKVTLVDSPGVLLAPESDPDCVLRNCVRLDKLVDPITPVETILRRCKTEQLLKLYQIAAFRSTDEFLTLIARSRGKMLKGGRADMLAAARTVLEDWNCGKVPFYTLPPAQPEVSAAHAAVVTQWSAEFDLEAVTAKEIASVEAAAVDNGENFMAMESGDAMNVDGLDEDEEVSGEGAMDEDEDESEEEKYECMV